MLVQLPSSTGGCEMKHKYSYKILLVLGNFRTAHVSQIKHVLYKHALRCTAILEVFFFQTNMHMSVFSM